jgi:hypothetical protein
MILSGHNRLLNLIKQHRVLLGCLLSEAPPASAELHTSGTDAKVGSAAIAEKCPELPVRLVIAKRR